MSEEAYIPARSIGSTAQRDFARRMLDIISDASTAFLCSIGHQTGLFDAMATLEPATCAEISRTTALHERYVQEWLDGMTVARIIDYDPKSGTYFLPPDHSASLTRAAGRGNVATLMQYFAQMGEVEQKVVRAFREGGGVSFDAYPRFQSLQREESRNFFDDALLDKVIPLTPGLADDLQEGIYVLDVGTGAGHAVNLLAQANPRSQFLGIDMSEVGIAMARREALAIGLNNVEFAICDSTEIAGEFDLVMAFDVIHDLARPTETVESVFRALKDGGTFLMCDINASSLLEENIDNTLGAALYAYSLFYCMTVSLAQGGAGLGKAWGKQRAMQMLTESGFGEVECKSITGDDVHAYYVARRGQGDAA